MSGTASTQAAVKPKATRQSFGEALAELGDSYRDVVVLDADLAGSTKCALFAKRHPERFFEVGIAEQNMVGVAAGMALSGKTAFCCSFACFVAGRFETIKISVSYSHANVKIVGTHAGIAIGEDGYSQMGLEDVALMRSLPLMQVYQPADDLETAQIVEHLCKSKEPAYLRLTRHNLERVHHEGYRFQPGKLDVLQDGADVALFASGGPVKPALDAAEQLRAKGVDAAVVNVPSIKPMDEEGIRQWAKKVPLIVSVEDHQVIGGMGSAVGELLAYHGGARLYRHGIHDTFGESGKQAELYAKYELDAAGIAGIVERELGRT